MADSRATTYRVREFAALTGVTVRTLHYYDRRGLLSPRRTRTGHRLYSRCDLESLEMILALKRIGVPLRDIARLRDARDRALADVFRSRRLTLEKEHRLLARLIAALHDVEHELADGPKRREDLFRRITEAIDTHTNDMEWEIVVRETSRHRQSLGQDVLADLGAQSEALLLEVQSVLDEDAHAPAVQQLAARWVDLIQRANGTALPLSVLMRHGEVTYRDHVRRSPSLATSLWARSLRLMIDAAALQGHA